jgi:alkylation response protein AidB-like acyl-CoA dehydrogenase
MTEASDLDGAIAMIRQSAAGIADRASLTRIRNLRFTMPGFERSVWRDMCEMGWPGLRLPEERGGVGMGVSAYCALAEELGAALAPEPLIGAALAAALVDDDTLDLLLSGVSLVLPAWQDERDALTPSADLRVEGGRLYGRKLYVKMAEGADAFLAIGRTMSWLIDADASGVCLETVETQDGGHLSTLILEGATGRPIARDPQPALAEACLATSAYLLGMIDAALAKTVEYLGMREQFGKKIGSFQALQHRAVDLRLQAELTRASVEDAAMRWDRDPASPASYAAISRAKIRAAGAAMLTTRQCIQLHGGIGFTDEHDIGLYLRKAMTTAPQFGSAALHKANYARLLPVGEGN